MRLLTLLIAIALSGCVAQGDGPDTTRKVDTQGNPNFGPR